MAMGFQVIRGFIKWKGKVYRAGEMLPPEFAQRDKDHNVWSKRIAQVERPDGPPKAPEVQKPTTPPQTPANGSNSAAKQTPASPTPPTGTAGSTTPPTGQAPTK